MKNNLYLFLAVSLGTCFIACQSQDVPESSTPPLPSVETVQVAAINYHPEVFGTGRLASKEESRLSFKTGGIVRRMRISEGQQVRKGQVLAELALEEINAQTQQAGLGVQNAQITIDNARLALERAERDYRNVEGLYQDSVATLEQFEDVGLALRNAKNQLAAAETGLALTEQSQQVAAFNLRYSTIVAPADGIILRQFAEINELIGPGTPVFLFGSREKAQVIRVNVTDKDIILLKLGDPATIEFDAYPQQSFAGTVQEMASLADPFTSTYEVEVALEPTEAVLLSGFIGSVTIRTRQAEALLQIPVDALVSADGKKGQVFVVDEQVARLTPVSIYELVQEQLLISEGLQAGQEVVVKGAGYLDNNDRVNSTPAPASPSQKVKAANISQ